MSFQRIENEYNKLLCSELILYIFLLIVLKYISFFRKQYNFNYNFSITYLYYYYLMIYYTIH